MKATLAGDSTAFRSLVERHHPACKRYARNMLGDADEAADATQEAFVRAYRSLGRYEDRGNFRAWLFTILVNRCRSRLARRASRAGHLALVDAPRTAGDPGSGILLRADLDRALGGLLPERREAFLMKHVEGLSYEEMSESTGASVSALKMRVLRAREDLREYLEGAG